MGSLGVSRGQNLEQIIGILTRTDRNEMSSRIRKARTQLDLESRARVALICTLYKGHVSICRELFSRNFRCLK